MTRIISIANQKGGVGKTTTAINLSAALAQLHQRVLLIDLDPQGNSGGGLGLDPMSIDRTIYDALIHECNINSVIKRCNEENLFIIPSNLKLTNLDGYITTHDLPHPFFLLKECLGDLHDDYDFIIIDCPPSLGVLSLNALAASTSALIPVQCEYFAMQAVAAVLSTINKVRNDYNPELKIEGFLLTMYDPRTSLDVEIGQEIRSLFKESTFLTTIPRNISIPEATYRGQAVTSFRPKAQGSLAYIALAREVLDNGQ